MNNFNRFGQDKRLKVVENVEILTSGEEGCNLPLSLDSNKTRFCTKRHLLQVVSKKKRNWMNKHYLVLK